MQSLKIASLATVAASLVMVTFSLLGFWQAATILSTLAVGIAATNNGSFQLGSLSASYQTSFAFDSGFNWAVSLPAGTSGTLGTRTDDDTGVVTAAGHGLSTSDVVDVWWSGGVRYGMDATVSGDDVTVDGGAGDVLPAQGTAVVITEQVSISMNIDGDNVAILGLFGVCPTSGARIHADLQDTGAASVGAFTINCGTSLTNVNGTHIYPIANGATNPITGNPVTDAVCSNSDPTNSATIYVAVGEDSTP